MWMCSPLDTSEKCLLRTKDWTCRDLIHLACEAMLLQIMTVEDQAQQAQGPDAELLMHLIFGVGQEVQCNMAEATDKPCHTIVARPCVKSIKDMQDCKQ